MSRTARRAYVTNPIAVQIRVPRAMTPVQPSTPEFCEAIACTCSGVAIPPESAISPGM